MYQDINFEIVDNIATITFNRPKKLNTITLTMMDEINEAIGQIAANSTVRALIIKGSEKVFGTGVDLESIPPQLKTAQETYSFAYDLYKMIDRIENLTIPTIAAIGGYALGGSLEIALGCDFRVASEKAKIGLPEIKIGAIPSGGGTVRLPKLIGSSRAKEILFSGDPISAGEALQIGLVNKVVPEEDLFVEAKKMADTFARRAPLALAMLKRLVNTADNVGKEQALANEAGCAATLFYTEDKVEGIQAFLEKRPPIFKGK